MDVYCSRHFGKQCLLTLFMDSVATDIGGIGTLHAHLQFGRSRP